MILNLSENNLVFHNNFINNRGGQAVSHVSAGSKFDKGLLEGGNYWDTFDEPIEGCNDLDSDGICDDHYVFSGNQDNFPFVNRDGWKAPVVREPVVIVPGIVWGHD